MSSYLKAVLAVAVLLLAAIVYVRWAFPPYLKRLPERAVEVTVSPVTRAPTPRATATPSGTPGRRAPALDASPTPSAEDRPTPSATVPEDPEPSLSETTPAPPTPVPEPRRLRRAAERPQPVRRTTPPPRLGGRRPSEPYGRPLSPGDEDDDEGGGVSADVGDALADAADDDGSPQPGPESDPWQDLGRADDDRLPLGRGTREDEPPGDDDGSGSLEESGQESDVEPLQPSLLKFIAVTPREVHPGGEAWVTASVHSESGLQMFEGELGDESGQVLVDFTCEGSTSPSICRTRVLIPEEAPAGRYKVTRLSVRDGEGQSASYQQGRDWQLDEAGVVVVDPRGDTEPPWLESVEATPQSVTAGEPFVLELRVSDNDSGVVSVRGRYESESGQHFKSFIAVPAGEENLFQARVYLARVEGRWGLKVLDLRDAAHNERSYDQGDPLLDGATVMVFASQDEEE